MCIRDRDWVTGWHGWSIDYVIPIICMVAMVLLAVIVKIKHMEISDYIIYLSLIHIYFQELEKAQLLQASRILTQALPLGWTSFEEAEKEIQKRMQLENVCLAALHEDRVIGWGGVMPIYGGNVYELHPLAVEQKWQKKGVGGALLKALEQEAQKLSLIHI